jgi:hypothetical protein
METAFADSEIKTGYDWPVSQWTENYVPWLASVNG